MTVWLLAGMIIDTGVMGSTLLKTADLTATQPSVPDVPYEPELDIEIDFPRGTCVPPRPPAVAAAFSHAVVPGTGPEPFVSWPRLYPSHGPLYPSRTLAVNF